MRRSRRPASPSASRDVGVADVPLVRHGPVEDLRPGRDLAPQQRRGQVALDPVERRADAVAGDAPADRVEVLDQRPHRISHRFSHPARVIRESSARDPKRVGAASPTAFVVPGRRWEGAPEHRKRAGAKPRERGAEGATPPAASRHDSRKLRHKVRSGSRRSRFDAVPVKVSAETDASAARQGHLSRRLHRLP